MIEGLRKYQLCLTVIVVFFFVLSLGSTSWVYAESEEAISARQEANQQKLAELQGELGKVREAAGTEAQKLGEIEGRLGERQRAYDEINNRMIALEANITETDQQIVIDEQLLEERREVLALRMREIYKKGKISYLDVLLGATDFVDFATRLQVLQKVLTNDINLINDVFDRQKGLAELKKNLEAEKVEVEKLRVSAAKERDVIAVEHAKQQEIYGRIFYEKELAEAQERELEKTSKELEYALRISRGEVGVSRGTMIHPLPGHPLTSVFSTGRVHPVFGGVRPHNGMDVGAPSGTAISAADGGEIIFTGWMGGYGYTTMVNHGGGIVTLYAHQNQHPPVSVGQMVAQGETVGYVGSTGYSTGPHLHFEVRVNGAVIDPQEFVQFY